MKIDLSHDAISEIVVQQLEYWIRYLETDGPHKEDNKHNKKVIKACKVLLEFYT